MIDLGYIIRDINSSMGRKSLKGNRMITQEKVFEIIEETSEIVLKDTIIRELKKSGKDMIENDFEFFIDYLKEDNLYTHLTGQYICKKPYEDAKAFLTKLINCFCIKDIHIDESLKLIRDNLTYILKRCSGWNVVEIPLVNDSLGKIPIMCASAQYKYVNNWGHGACLFANKIIYSDTNVLWIEKDTQNMPQYFILKNGNIYGISYEHKFITIYHKVDNAFKKFTVNTGEMDFDEIINKYESGKQHINETKIDLSEYFDKGFFYKGMLFDGNWKKEITVLKNIEFVNGLLKIGIENLTYPHTGYILLEMEDNKIVEAKSISLKKEKT
jgi:hypothetical protein